jgi:hypothetical protein
MRKIVLPLLLSIAYSSAMDVRCPKACCVRALLQTKPCRRPSLPQVTKRRTPSPTASLIEEERRVLESIKTDALLPAPESRSPTSRDTSPLIQKTINQLKS